MAKKNQRKRKISAIWLIILAAFAGELPPLTHFVMKICHREENCLKIKVLANKIIYAYDLRYNFSHTC